MRRQYVGEWKYDVPHGVGRGLVVAGEEGMQLYAGEHWGGRREGHGRCTYVRWGRRCGGHAQTG